MTKILIVDDSVSMRQMIVFTLKEAGYVVEEAENGQKGLDKAKSQKFDVVISDVNMPIMDGITMVKQVRSLPNYKFVPILVLTTETSQEKKQEGKQAGATGWLVKPFNPEQLISTIKRVVN